MGRGGGSRALSVFKGRETRLNKAIIWILALKGPSTAYDICREVRAQRAFQYTRYSVVNRRVRALEEKGYLEKIGTRRTKAGFEASLYRLTPRAYLAIALDQIDLDSFLEADEATVLTALGALTPYL